MPEKEKTTKEPETKYFGVFYSKDGTIHLFPGDTQDECLLKLNNMLAEDDRVLKRCKATTVIKRDMSNFKDGFIFGNPKSLNMLLQYVEEDPDTKPSKKNKGGKNG